MAAMRKLLVICFRVLKTGNPADPAIATHRPVSPTGDRHVRHWRPSTALQPGWPINSTACHRSPRSRSAFAQFRQQLHAPANPTHVTPASAGQIVLGQTQTLHQLAHHQGSSRLANGRSCGASITSTPSLEAGRCLDRDGAGLCRLDGSSVSRPAAPRSVPSLLRLDLSYRLIAHFELARHAQRSTSAMRR